MTRHGWLAGLLAWAALAGPAQAGESFGQPLEGLPAASLSELLARPEAGKVVRLEGTVEKVCQNKGCWLALKQGEDSVHVTFAGYAFFVPKDCAGRPVALEGVVRVRDPRPDEVEHLKHEGAGVCITGRRAQVLEEAAAELGVDFLPGDVGEEEDARRTVDAFVERSGRIDILVNNAGIGYFAPLLETELGRLVELYRTNVFGAFLMAREAARHFVKQRSGHLVNISSTAGLRGFQGGTAYASSKFEPCNTTSAP